MNQRSHILYEQLKGFVQRMDMNVAKKDLPPKTVFVIAVKLSPLQRKLYKKFLDVHGFTNDKVYNEKIRKRSFFAGYQALAQVDKLQPCEVPKLYYLLIIQSTLRCIARCRIMTVVFCCSNDIQKYSCGKSI